MCFVGCLGLFLVVLACFGLFMDINRVFKTLQNPAEAYMVVGCIVSGIAGVFLGFKNPTCA
jgi:hypothetical protein